MSERKDQSYDPQEATKPSRREFLSQVFGRGAGAKTIDEPDTTTEPADETTFKGRNLYSRREAMELGVVVGTAAYAAARLRVLQIVIGWLRDGHNPEYSPQAVVESGTEGLHSQDALDKLPSLEQQKELDQIIGVTYVDPKYGARYPQDSLEWGLDVAQKMGFRGPVELEYSPREDKYKIGYEGSLGEMPLDEIYGKPFEREGQKLVITTQVGEGVVSTWELHVKDDRFSDEALQQVEDEYYNFTSNIHQRHGQIDQEILILLGNETDFNILGQLPRGNTPEARNSDPDPIVFDNAVGYFGAAIRGIQKANAENPESKKRIRSGIEVFAMRDVMGPEPRQRMINAVIPRLNEHGVGPDVIGYSAYEFFTLPEDFAEAIRIGREYAPNAAHMVTEIGFPENEHMIRFNRDQVGEGIRDRIEQGRQLGIEAFMFWGLIDNEAPRNPNNDQGKGFRMVNPDGSFSNTFQVLQGV